MSNLPLRNEVPVDHTWDLSLLFSSQEAFEEAILNYHELLETIQTYKGKLINAEEIIDALSLYEKIIIDFSKISHYGELAYEVDKLDPLKEENNASVRNLRNKTGAATAFIRVEIAENNIELLQSVMDSDEGKGYRVYIQDIIDHKDHILSEEMETFLGFVSSELFNQYQIYNTLMYQDLSFADFSAGGKTYSNSFAGFEGEYEVDLKAEVRHNAWKSFHAGLSKYQNTAAINYISHTQTEKKLSLERGYESVFDYLLADQGIDRSTYDKHIDLLMTEFAPVMQRYARLLKEKHGLDTMSLADIKIPYSTDSGHNLSISEGEEIVKKALSVYGPDYNAYVDRAFNERWIDFPMNQTKTTGGFSTTVPGGPSYVLLNWTGYLSEALVLAHELGHSSHFQLTYQNQSVLSPEVSLYFVEAPSTCNEVITCQYLLNGDLSHEDKIGLIGEFISRTYFHNMVTHLLEADFQRKVYQAVDRFENLNADKLNRFFYDTLKKFWGDALEINEGAELTWMRQPHYFMGLYSYTYSAGLTIGTQVGLKIANQDQEVIENWLTALKAGSSLNPLELTNYVGVDMSTPDALRATIQYVSSLVDHLEEDCNMTNA
ncbi:oligoendopeptidase F [Facklamia languida]